jgi:hypothetical protein
MRSNETIVVMQTIQVLHNKLDLLFAEVATLTNLVQSLQEGVEAWGEPISLDDLLRPDEEDTSSDGSSVEDDVHN